MPDLSLVSTDDLITELKSRFDVFAGMGARENNYDEESTVYEAFCKGPTYAVVGLWELFKERELNNYILTSRELEDGEDV